MSDKPGPPTEFVIMPAGELSALVSRAVRDALCGRESGALLVDKQTLAQKLCCSAAHVDKLRKRGLPVVHVGESVRFEPGKVLEWLRHNGSTDSE